MTRLSLSQACVVLVVALSIAANVTAQEPLRVMSFNIRYGAANDGENVWKKRNWLVAETIQQFKPDLLGTQETLSFQADYLKGKLKGYTYFGRSRMKSPNEHCGIFFRSDRFAQLAGGHFWLSESPDVIESKSWDSSLPRMATWLLLSDKQAPDSPPVLFLNTHFDHRGQVARLEAAKVIRQRIAKIEQIADEPYVVITGDFNTAEASAPYQAFFANGSQLVDTFRTKHRERTEEEGTFNGFQGRNQGGRIDWILASSRLHVLDAAIDTTNENGRYPSDHFPVTAVLATERVATPEDPD